MPWEQTDEFIRSGHRSPDDFQPDSLRTITISEEEGIKAVIGKPKGQDTTEVQSYLFAVGKGWTLEKAKAWFEQHQPKREHVSMLTPFVIVKESLLVKPLKTRGVAMVAGVSRNFNIYTEEELEAFAKKLVGSPVYFEHVSATNAVGKVTKTEWNPESKVLFYEAEIHDEETAEKIRRGLIQHVSVAADYERLDVVDGKIPHGLSNAELSLVAVPGIPGTNIQVAEALDTTFKELVRGTVKEVLKEQEDERAKLRQAQLERAKKCGIAPKEGGNLTKPSDYANVPDDQFADLTNYRYPVDAEHVQGALTYFNQPDNRRDYSHEEAVKIMTKIVQSALAKGIEVSYQSEDPVYRDLPEDLKTKMKGYEQKGESIGESKKPTGQGIVVPQEPESEPVDLTKVKLRDVMEDFS